MASSEKAPQKSDSKEHSDEALPQSRRAFFVDWFWQGTPETAPVGDEQQSQEDIYGQRHSFKRLQKHNAELYERYYGHLWSNAQQAPAPEPDAAEGTSTAPSKPPAVEKLSAKKQDLSNYFDDAKLTERQRECISLRLEYGLSITKIAQRLRIDRKTVRTHVDAASVKMKAAISKDKLRKAKAKSGLL